ncbi:hypothetical protein IV203_027673 [Nitzschia inconspicua]|uniref:Uncharacterized protein n=1 Tax=Nitzschia inconspicua TaxID=303405 RepID=A0A9K3Q3J6_9STRA|nr:hypothetical protein IV203_027673 [Nitzschia inconspicua]
MEISNAVYLQGSTSNALSEEDASMETVLADTVVLMANEAMETTSTAASSEANEAMETTKLYHRILRDLDRHEVGPCTGDVAEP